MPSSIRDSATRTLDRNHLQISAWMQTMFSVAAFTQVTILEGLSPETTSLHPNRRPRTPVDVAKKKKNYRGTSDLYMSTSFFRSNQLSDRPTGSMHARVTCMPPGDHFGEKALVEKTPRTATVKAHGPVKCAALSIAGFERLMVSDRLSAQRGGKTQRTRARPPCRRRFFPAGELAAFLDIPRTCLVYCYLVRGFPSRDKRYSSGEQSILCPAKKTYAGPVRRHAHNGVQQPCRRQDREAVTQGRCLGFLNYLEGGQATLCLPGPDLPSTCTRV